MSYHSTNSKASVDADYRDDYKDADAGNITATLTTTQILNGVLYSDPSGGAATLTLPTAALLVAADKKSEAKKGLHFYIRNEDGTNAITMAVGTGGTLKGSAVLAANGYAHFYVYYSNVTASSEAYDLIRLG